MKNVAIVGAWVNTRLDAPYGDPGWEIWTCSCSNHGQLPRADVWFEIHDMETLNRVHAEKVADYLAHLESVPTVYMQDMYVPNATLLPLEMLLARFGRQWFKNTFCYMLALAIIRQPETIGMWGIGPKSTTSQGAVPSIQHLIAMARRDGIEVICPEFLDAPDRLYAYEEE